MDRALLGPSKPADVASVGQQQTLPGGTNAHKGTGPTQCVQLLSPQTHRHATISPYAPLVKVLMSCIQLEGGVDKIQSSM